jgi:hypothetical protein
MVSILFDLQSNITLTMHSYWMLVCFGPPLACLQPVMIAIALGSSYQAGALNRSDIASPKVTNLPPWFVRWTSHYLLSLVGETWAVGRGPSVVPLAH